MIDKDGQRHCRCGEIADVLCDGRWTCTACVGGSYTDRAAVEFTCEDAIKPTLAEASPLARFRFYTATATRRAARGAVEDWGTVLAAIPQEQDAVLISACEMLDQRNKDRRNGR